MPSRGLEADFLVQEFIKESGGADIRCFVIGDKVIAAHAAHGSPRASFRSNLHRGGTALCSAGCARTSASWAVKAAQVMGLDVAGVGHHPLEPRPRWCWKSIPHRGLEGIERATGKGHCRGPIIAYMEKRCAEGAPNKMKGQG
jgi:ribosomal protein S6--L-glutamate ligase